MPCSSAWVCREEVVGCCWNRGPGGVECQELKQSITAFCSEIPE